MLRCREVYGPCLYEIHPRRWITMQFPEIHVARNVPIASRRPSPSTSSSSTPSLPQVRYLVAVELLLTTQPNQMRNLAQHDDLIDLFVFKSLKNKTPTSFLLQEFEETSDTPIATFPTVKASLQTKSNLKRSLVYAVGVLKRRNISFFSQNFLSTWS